MKYFVAVWLASVVLVAHAHQGEEPASQATGYDCENPPQDVVTTVPGALGETARLVCLPAGQAIVSDKAWSWRYTGSFFDMPMVPAHAHKDSAGLAPPFFFHHIDARELSTEETTQRNQELMDQVVTYRPESDLTGMSEIEAESNYGLIVKMYLAKESGDKRWLVVCAPECRPDYVIIVNKLQKN